MNNDKLEETGHDTNKKSSIFRYSIFVGRIGEVPINIHFSFALIFSLIVWTLSYTFFPFYYPSLGQLNYIILGLTGGFIALFSILLHELGHSTIAKKYGIKFERIVLFAFGGVALSDNEIADPKKEINMAFAGPCISFISSSLSFSLWLILIRSHIFSLESSPLGGVLLYGGLINLGIGLFNLLPLFPSDGGRILRALLSKHNNHDHVRGTKGAIRIGVIVSLGLVLVGVIIGLNYSFLSGLWLMILAFFLIKQSKWYYRQYQDLSPRI
ncbi:MAG TPA: site-2 protease family protein [Nitrososphaeraceae archaeon]